MAKLIESVPTGGKWGTVAARLLEIKCGCDRGPFEFSFSSFINELSKDRAKTKSTFWRLVRAGEAYRDTRDLFGSNGTELPELIDPAILATPESIEIVEKIRRAAPTDTANEIAYRTMKGLISRSELRDLWEAYRPILKGENARGKRSKTPRFNRHDPEMREAQDRANRIAPVILSKPDWLGLKQFPYSYRVTNIPVNGQSESILNAVAALAETAKSSIILHGFYAGNFPYPVPLQSKSDTTLMDVAHLSDLGVNFVWLACTEIPKRSVTETLSNDVGILTCDGRIQIERAAKPLKPAIGAREKLLSDLLRESLCIKPLHPETKKTNIL
ncbi:MAG TPA: hypothetical protein VF283_16760 [Bryobacteraceae bacterium]